jgi:hypothetical protein
MADWSGGMTGGPIVLYASVDGAAPGASSAAAPTPHTAAASASSALNPPATTTVAVLGPSNEFKTAILSRVGNRVVGGVQGNVVEIPGNYTLRYALIGRADGITSGMMGYGAMLRKAHGTAATKLPLSADPLSRQL